MEPDELSNFFFRKTIFLEHGYFFEVHILESQGQDSRLLQHTFQYIMLKMLLVSLDVLEKDACSSLGGK